MKLLLLLMAALGPTALVVPRVASAAEMEGGAAPAVLRVGPNRAALRYEGRWDITDLRATTVNSGSRIYLRFTGDEVSAVFDIDGVTRAPQVYAYVDGAKSAPIVVDRSRIMLTEAGLPWGTHELVFVVKDVAETGNRWVPPFESALQLEGFELPAGSTVLRPPAAPKTRLTFLGDSITQGVNILCPVPGPTCADATLDYAWLVADAFSAGLEQVGFGAQGVTTAGNGNVPPAAQALDLNFHDSPASPWEPDVVVINQGTNDSQAGPVAIRTAYLQYLHRVRQRYPQALVLALEPLGLFGQGSSAGLPIQQAVATFGDPRVEYVSTTGWTGALDFTEGLHPNAEGHRKLAARLIDVISSRTHPSPSVGPWPGSRLLDPRCD